MQLTKRHSFASDPDTVLAMMADEVWLAEVARRAGAERWQVSVDDRGSHVHAEVPAPEKAKRLTGPTLVIDLTMHWQPQSADGTHHGTIDVTIERMPAAMHGTGVMRPAQVDGAAGTVIDYDAEFSINVPLVGRSLETAAAPYVERVIDTQQDVGRDYLAGRLS